MLAQKNSARVADAFESFFGHGENADLVDGTKTVLDRPHQPELAVGVAFKIQHGIDHVLEHARPGQRALLGHMADQNNADAGRFGRTRQVRRAFAYLGYRARRGAQLIRIHGLDGIDHRHIGLLAAQCAQNFFQLDFGQHTHLRGFQPEAARAQSHLGAAFLTGDVQGIFSGALQRVQGLQQQRGLANARVAAYQYHATLHNAAAQHPVQLGVPGGCAVHVTGFNIGQYRHLRCTGQRGKAVAHAAIGRRDRFHQGVPGRAGRAFAQPLGAGAAALIAGK